jgi:Flp pilus assembly protein TadD
VFLTLAATALLSGSTAELSAAMLARGLPAAEIVISFESTPEIAAYARGRVGAERQPAAQAAKLFAAVSDLVSSGAIVADAENAPKVRAPKTASGLLRVATSPAKGSADRLAGCYEFTSLFVALCRSLGLEAFGVTRGSVVDSGQIGHVMAGLRLSGSGPPTVFDLQNRRRGVRADVRELTDLELAAYHYNHLAVAAYLHDELRRAADLVRWAVALSPETPDFLANRATVLAALGEREIATAEALHAVELAPAVPIYRYGLGRLLLQANDLQHATEQLREALRLYPAYGLAKRDLGWAELLLGDAAGAEQLLREAARVSPPVPDAWLFLGLVHLARGEGPAAAALAQSTLSVEPANVHAQALLALAVNAAPTSPAIAAEVERLRRVLQPAIGGARR